MTFRNIFFLVFRVFILKRWNGNYAEYIPLCNVLFLTEYIISTFYILKKSSGIINGEPGRGSTQQQAQHCRGGGGRGIFNGRHEVLSQNPNSNGFQYDQSTLTYVQNREREH